MAVGVLQRAAEMALPQAGDRVAWRVMQCQQFEAALHTAARDLRPLHAQRDGAGAVADEVVQRQHGAEPHRLQEAGGGLGCSGAVARHGRGVPGVQVWHVPGLRFAGQLLQQ